MVKIISKNERISLCCPSWQKLRDSGEIIWSKERRLIQYSRKSIENYIEKNRMV